MKFTDTPYMRRFYNLTRAREGGTDKLSIGPKRPPNWMLDVPVLYKERSVRQLRCVFWFETPLTN